MLLLTEPESWRGLVLVSTKPVLVLVSVLPVVTAPLIDYEQKYWSSEEVASSSTSAMRFILQPCTMTARGERAVKTSLLLPTGSHLCPRSLDCARAGRHFCLPGSSHCGACLRPLVENSHGRCVVRRRHAPHATQSTKGEWFFMFQVGPSHLGWIVHCCDKHQIISHIELK